MMEQVHTSCRRNVCWKWHRDDVHLLWLTVRLWTVWLPVISLHTECLISFMYGFI